MLAGAAGVYLGLFDTRATPKPATNLEVSERPPVAAPANNPPTTTGGVPFSTPPEPESKKPEAPPPVTIAIPPLTPFRRLVFEADAVAALIAVDEQGYVGPNIEVIHLTLKAIRSDFTTYSESRKNGPLTAQEQANLRADAAIAFSDPDVNTAAFSMQLSPRVHLWLREGVKLPRSETKPPDPGDVPFRRRLQEAVATTDVANWLAAIEGEFGSTDFGKGEQGLPLDIVVFADQPRYLEFAKKRLQLNVPQWSAGFFTAGWDVICAPILESTSLAEVLRHEIFHALQARLAYASLTVPWFAEGTAEWLDKAPPKDGVLVTHSGFAAGARGHLRFLVEQGYPLDLSKFLALDLAAFYTEPELNYLIAYCFVDFLRAEEDLRKVYFEFWEAMKGGMQPPDAFYRTLGALNMQDVQRRFLKWLSTAELRQIPVKFTHDAPADSKDLKLPTKLGSTPAAGRPGEISSAWYQALGKLEEAGFSTKAPSYFKGNYDMLIVACDNSESMGRPLDEATFDFEAFRRWLFCVRYAGSIKLTRTSVDGENDEEVPPTVLISLVESVITGRVDDFVAATGIKIGDELQKQIKKGWDDFYLTADKLKSEPRRQLCLYTAESVAWYWGVRQDKANVVMVDFNSDTKIERESNAFTGSGVSQSSASPLLRLFAKTAGHQSPIGSDGADTDWWLGLSGTTQSGSDVLGKRAAIMFFTDGPCSAGEFGQVETARGDERYFTDMARLAERFGEAWRNAALDAAGRDSALQIFALPHAEKQGLDEILKTVPQARLDEWAIRFKK